MSEWDRNVVGYLDAASIDTYELIRDLCGLNAFVDGWRTDVQVSTDDLCELYAWATAYVPTMRQGPVDVPFPESWNYDRL
jgi:hypothetical protein